MQIVKESNKKFKKENYNFEMKKKCFFCILLAGLLLLLLPNLSRTLMISLDMETLILKAENIIIGKVVGKECRWDKEKTTIYTYTTVSVEEDFIGDTTGKEVVIKYPGGEVGEIGLVVEDTPQFNVDEEVLLFLENLTEKGEKTEHKTVVGSFQGKFCIRKNPITGERVVISKGKLDKEKWEIGEGIPLITFREETLRIVEKLYITHKTLKGGEEK